MTLTSEEYCKYKALLTWVSWSAYKAGERLWEDDVHDAFLAYLKAERVESKSQWLHTVARRTALRRRDHWLRMPSTKLPSKLRSNEDLEQKVGGRVEQEKHRRIIERLIAVLPKHQKEIVTRFYLLEQPKEQIIAEMQLTETQFRLTKSRALAKLRQAADNQCVLGS